MITLSLFLALQAPLSHPSVSWVAELMMSKSAQAVLSKSPPPRRIASSVPVRSPKVVSSPGVTDLRLTLVPYDCRPAIAAIHRMADLIDVGNLEGAYFCISTFREDNPELAELVGPDVVECELLTGRYDDAYRESLTYIRDHLSPRSIVGDIYYLQLSLAAAGRGQVYDGQIKYCTDYFNNVYRDSWGNYRPTILSRSNDETKQAMIASLFARSVGSPFAQAYLESVLKLEPTNSLAGHMLMEHDTMQQRYSDLRRVASFMIARAKDKESLDFYQKQITAVAGLMDRPKIRKTSVTP